MGFIGDLSAAFRVTLDDFHEADVFLHVIDVSNLNFGSHIRAVERMLEGLDIGGKQTISVFNKKDRFPDKDLHRTLCQRVGAITITAPNPEILPPHVEKMEALVNQTWPRMNPIKSKSLYL